MPTQTAWALIQADPSLDSFEQIVNAAGMQGALESGSITVLAPASGAIGDVSSIIADQATAQDFVESHIISGSLDSAAIFATTNQVTLDGDPLTIDGVAQTITGPSGAAASITSARQRGHERLRPCDQRRARRAGSAGADDRSHHDHGALTGAGHRSRRPY